LRPANRINSAETICSGKLLFLNKEHEIGWMPDWNPRDLPGLWVYNLHYFEWLWAFAADRGESSGQARSRYGQAKAVVLNWIIKHGPSRGHVGWEPYPTALRLTNWSAFFFVEHRAWTLEDAEFAQTLWESIWRQTEWLGGHLEYHLLGNHLLEDAAALTYAGTCFDGPDAARWLAQGSDLLARQIPEQILDDGMHFELSPMYHSRIVYLFLVLYGTGHTRVQSIVGPVLKPMLAALAKVLHPDGRIALVNDSAFGIYNEARELIEYAAQMGIETPDDDPSCGSWSLNRAGYYGFRGGDGSYIICDAGRIGPDYIPGHAHADCFSFELSVGGQRVIVDSGVHDYEVGEERRYCRSTSAHNTVEIEGLDQSRMWGAFRVAGRGYPHDVKWFPQTGGFTLAAWHDGYCRLPGHPRHARTFQYRVGGWLHVTDRVQASRDVTCRSYLHLHPDCRIEQDEDSVKVIYPSGRCTIRFFGDGRLVCMPGSYHPSFYVTRKCTVLVWTWKASPGHAETGFDIEPLR
jgi:uncharacterized heparinase superfamily protein